MNKKIKEFISNHKVMIGVLFLIIVSIYGYVFNDYSYKFWELHISLFSMFGSGMMAYLAWKALSAWEKEYIGKKQIDLAQELVSDVCNFRDLIKHARDPFFLTVEQEKILKDLEDQKQRYPNIKINEHKIYYLAAIYRIADRGNELNNFFELRNKAQLYWGDGLSERFTNLKRIITRLEISAKDLYEFDNLAQDEIKKLENSIWDINRVNDEINVELDQIVNEFKLNLEPLYKSQIVEWEKLDE